MLKNIKFNDFFNNSVIKIKLQPGQKLTYKKFKNHDEGWTIYIIEYDYNIENNCIYCNIYDDGTDCDGRLQSEEHFKCEINDLKHRYNTEFNTYFPNWKLINNV